jgi:hypothetical protein
MLRSLSFLGAYLTSEANLEKVYNEMKRVRLELKTIEKLHCKVDKFLGGLDEKLGARCLKILFV